MDLSVSDDLAPCNNTVTINKQSDSELHEEVFKIAKYFKEELDYDSIPYSQLGFIPKEDKVLLFTEEALDVYKTKPMPHRIYGACYFKRMKFSKGEDYWALEWIWLHPFFRNRGNLKKHWTNLEEKFGAFLIKEPVSHDMTAFLEHIKSKYLHKII